MCRSIKTLHNFQPPATEDEIRAAALQFVRKVSGYRKPSAENAPAFDAAVHAIAEATIGLLDTLVARGTPKTREEERARAKARFAARRERLVAEGAPG